MNRTMRVFAWIVIGSLVCQTVQVLGLEASLPTTEVTADAKTERSDDVRAADMNLQEGNDLARDHSSAKLRQVGSDDCEHLNITGGYGPVQIREIRSKDYSFFLQPKANFDRLIIRLRVQSVLDASDIMDTEEKIEFFEGDLGLGDRQSGWLKVHVQYFEYSSRGPNSHALQVTVGNTTRSAVTGHWWLLYTYEGFILSAEGGADIVFNCSPDEYFGEAVHSSRLVWLLAGCLMSLMLVIVALCCVLVMHKKHTSQREDVVSSPPNSLVYEEFDEEMLERIRQKVEILREGRVSESSDSGGKGKHYALQMTPLQDSPTVDTCRKGVEEEPEEDRYKVPVSLKRSGRFHQGIPLKQDYCNDVHLHENHYETIYPLDISTPLRHEVPKDQSRKAAMKPRNHIEVDLSSEENIYEHLYIAA